MKMLLFISRFHSKLVERMEFDSIPVHGQKYPGLLSLLLLQKRKLRIRNVSTLDVRLVQEWRLLAYRQKNIFNDKKLYNALFICIKQKHTFFNDMNEW